MRYAIQVLICGFVKPLVANWLVSLFWRAIFRPAAPRNEPQTFTISQDRKEAQREILLQLETAGGTAPIPFWSFWRIFVFAKNDLGHIKCAFAESVFLALHLQETHKARLKRNATTEHFVRKPQRKSLVATLGARGGLGVGEILGQTQGFAPPPL